MTKNEISGEFDLIHTYFAPLSKLEGGAFELTDDAAVLKIDPARELVVTTDTIVAGVHFLEETSPDAIAAKLLRISLSDLAAMGATPHAYTLSLALTDAVTEEWLQGFSDALARDQDEYGITLVGGDTVFSPGPLTLTLTAMGTVPAGKALRRNGAKVGDDIYVTGTIGDGALGLLVAQSEITELLKVDADYLADRYEYPQPRGELGERLIDIVHAAADISDGLVADLAHICQQSKVSAVIQSTLIPLSDAATSVLDLDSSYLQQILSGGDDYELIFTASQAVADELKKLSPKTGIQVTRIGVITAGTDEAVQIEDGNGDAITLQQKGYRHF